MTTTLYPFEAAPPADLTQQVIDTFWESVPPTWHTVRAQLRATAADQFGITVEQFHILRHVRRGVGSVSDLAEVKQISRSAISQAVEVLVEKGLLSRTPDAKDRRCVHLSLTETGADLLQSIFQQNRAWMREKMASLDPQELAEIQQALKLLKTVFMETPA